MLKRIIIMHALAFLLIAASGCVHRYVPSFRLGLSVEVSYNQADSTLVVTDTLYVATLP